MSLFQFYNPNPKGKLVGDCVKRCLTKATGEDYMSIQRQLNAIHRELGTRTYQDKRVYKAFVERRDYRKISFPAKRGEPRTTVRDVAEMQARNADGLKDYNIVCNCAHHLVCVSEGQYWDTWNSGNKCVYNAWLVPINATSEVDQLKEQIVQKLEGLSYREVHFNAAS